MTDGKGRAVPAFTMALGFVSGFGPGAATRREEVAALVDAAAGLGRCAPGGADAAQALDRAGAHSLHLSPGTPVDPAGAAAALGMQATGRTSLWSGCELEVVAPKPRTLPDAPTTATVSLDIARLAREAAAAVRPGGWEGSRFETAFGPMPRSVAIRVEAMAERPLIAPVLARTALDALLDEARRLALAVPGSVGTAHGVEWRCWAGSGSTLDAPLAWLATDGPACLVTGVRVEPGASNMPAGRFLVGPAEGSGGGAATPGGRFALLTPPDFSALLGGDPVFGTCLVDGEVATVSFHETESGALAAAAGATLIPSPGGVPFALTAESEFEAIAHVADAVVRRAPGPREAPRPEAPAGFERRPATSEGGLAIRAGDYGIDVLVGHALAGGLGWGPGTRIDASLDPGAMRIALHHCADGAPLEESSAPSGHPALEPDRTLPGVPRWLLRTLPGEWTMVPYAAGDGHLVIDVRDVEAAAAPAPAAPEDGSLPVAVALGSKLLPRLTAAVAAGALILAAWGVAGLVRDAAPPPQALPLSLGESVMPTPPGLGGPADPL